MNTSSPNLTALELLELGYRLTEERLEHLKLTLLVWEARGKIRGTIELLNYIANQHAADGNAMIEAYLGIAQYEAFRSPQRDPAVRGRPGKKQPVPKAGTLLEGSDSRGLKKRAIVIDWNQIFVFQDPRRERVYASLSGAAREGAGFSGDGNKFWKPIEAG